MTAAWSAIAAGAIGLFAYNLSATGSVLPQAGGAPGPTVTATVPNGASSPTATGPSAGATVGLVGASSVPSARVVYVRLPTGSASSSGPSASAAPSPSASPASPSASRTVTPTPSPSGASSSPPAPAAVAVAVVVSTSPALGASIGVGLLGAELGAEL